MSQVPETINGTLAAEHDDDAAPARPEVDQERIKRAVREILAAVGEDPDREGLLETPARVARMYAEMFSGLHEDPRLHLKKFFTEKYDEVVLVRDISFNSMCEHHMLPFIGKAHIGYVPNGRVIGLSKLARVVEMVSRRPQVQERMTETIANLLEEELKAKGVAVVIEASHSCMTIRGIRKPGSVCVTSAMRGVFRSNLSSRSEIMTLIYGERRITKRVPYKSPLLCSAHGRRRCLIRPAILPRADSDSICLAIGVWHGCRDDARLAAATSHQRLLPQQSLRAAGAERAGQPVGDLAGQQR